MPAFKRENGELHDFLADTCVRYLTSNKPMDYSELEIERKNLAVFREVLFKPKDNSHPLVADIISIDVIEGYLCLTNVEVGSSNAHFAEKRKLYGNGTTSETIQCLEADFQEILAELQSRSGTNKVSYPKKGEDEDYPAYISGSAKEYGGRTRVARLYGVAIPENFETDFERKLDKISVPKKITRKEEKPKPNLVFLIRKRKVRMRATKHFPPVKEFKKAKITKLL